ncbi:MAG: family 16 glycosylhydrolase [Bacteroidota bacterium]|nr:family 16 glycosylhydrolase [Bacteroidota bacterium]
MRNRFFIFFLFCYAGAAPVAGQERLNRAAFQATPVFAEEFSYSSAADSTFRTRWDTDFYTAVTADGTEYASSGQVKMLPGGYVQLRTTRLSLPERQAITDSAARHGVVRPAPIPPRGPVPRPGATGCPIGYASCKLVSKVVGDPPAPATGAHFNGFTYGLFEIRCKLPRSGQGIMPAFWIHSPGTEIDIIDNTTEIPHRQWQLGVLDWEKRNEERGDASTQAKDWSRGFQKVKHGRSLAREFNTYSMVWTPREVTFYFNDEEVFTAPADEIATHPETARIILNVATRGDDQFANGEMVVDYVRVWKFAPPLTPATYRKELP